MFERIFNMDNLFWRTMNLVMQLTALSLVTAVLCLPVITAGAALTALYSVMMKMVNREDCAVMKDYFRGFRRNFRQATISWMLLLAVGALLVIDLYIVTKSTGRAATGLTYLFIMLAGFWILEFSVLFPLLSRYDNILKNSIKNALILGISSFLPWGLLMMVLNALPMMIAWYRFSWLLGVMTVMIFGGIGVIALLNSLMMYRVIACSPDASKKSTKEEKPNKFGNNIVRR